MLHKISFLSAVTLLVLAISPAPRTFAQSYSSQRAMKIVLAGNQTDVRKTLTIITKALTHSDTILLPGDNTQGFLANDGTGNLTWVSGNPGSVTSITAGLGLTGGTITNSGTIALDTARSDMWTGIHTFAPLNDSTSVTIRQSSAGAPHAHILDVTNNTGSTKYLSVDSAGNTSVQKIGANTTSPNTTVDVAGDFATREHENSGTGATLNNVPTAGASFLCFPDETQDYTITGFAGGQNGKLLHVYNESDHKLTIANQSSSSDAGNRINTLNGFDLTLDGRGMVDFLYDSGANEWLTRSTVSSGVTGGVTPGVDYGVVFGVTENGTGSDVTDTNLTFKCVQNGVYEVQGVLRITMNSNGSFGMGFTAGSGSVISIPFTMAHMGTGNNVYDNVALCTTEATTVVTSGLKTGTTYYIQFDGILVAGATGRAHLVWNLPDGGSPSTLNANCYMRAMRLK